MKLAYLGALVTGLVLFPTPTYADVADELSAYVGYTIVAAKRIDRWVSSDGEKAGNGFAGCEYGKAIIFTDGTYLKCASYGYQYAYGAQALILSDGSSVVMIVRDRVYRMRP